MMTELMEARRLLEAVTPLKTDCGRVCAGACCHSLEGEETGMLLFPGEDELYAGHAEYRIRRTAGGQLLVCSGTCDRTMRPLACRLFPLLPALRDGEIRVETDARARAVCPLAKQGKSALSAEFVEAVGRVGELLSKDPAQAAFLSRLTREHDDLRALRRKFSGR